MTILSRNYIIKGEYISSVFVLIISFIFLLPLVFLEYVSNHKLETLVFILFLSFVIAIYFYNSSNENLEINFVEKFIIKILGKKNIFCTNSIDKSIRCSNCNTGNRFNLDYVCKKGYISIFGVETSYHFSEHLCNNCGKTSNFKIEKLSYWHKKSIISRD